MSFGLGFVCGFATPILLLFILGMGALLIESIQDAHRRWKINRRNAIYAEGYEDGRRDCGEDPTR